VVARANTLQLRPANVAVLVDAANYVGEHPMDDLGLPSAVRAGLERQSDPSAGDHDICVSEQPIFTIKAPGLLELSFVDEMTQHCNEYLHALLSLIMPYRRRELASGKGRNAAHIDRTGMVGAASERRSR